MFLRESLVRTMKKVLFDNFQAYFIVFDHVNACASMRSLVEIHNTWWYYYSNCLVLLKLLENKHSKTYKIEGLAFIYMDSDFPPYSLSLLFTFLSYYWKS